MVLDLDQFSIRRRLGQAEDRTVVNPWVARDDAVGFARPKQDSRQYFHNRFLLLLSFLPLVQ